MEEERGGKRDCSFPEKQKMDEPDHYLCFDYFLWRNEIICHGRGGSRKAQ